MILHTETFGSGEALVFLHTGLQTGLTDFDFHREYFKGDYLVVLPDLRGHGKSVSSDLTNFFEDCATDLSETLDHLGITSAHMVGASLGALVGLLFAKRFPEKVKSLTISGVTQERPENWLEMHKADVSMQSQLLQNEDAVNYFDRLHAANWKQFLYMGRDEDWYPFDATKDLAGIKSPVLFIAGEGSPHETKGAISYPATAEHVHVSILPFASHLVHAEQPELYTKILELFLNKKGV